MESSLQVSADVVLAREFCEVGERAQRFEAEAALVKLRLYGK
jgi:hypothetical protein